MPLLIDTHPRLAPIVAAIVAAGLMTLLVWLMEARPVTDHWPAIVSTSVGVFLAMAYLSRRRRRQREISDPAARPERRN